MLTVTSWFSCDSALSAFRRVRRAAMLETWIARLQRRRSTLLSYHDIRQRFPEKLVHVRVPGEQPVPLSAIVGSVGRFADFTPSFRPRHDALKSRWIRIRCRWGQPPTFSPVRLYQLGDLYFVEDGNHRVSVAREQGAPFVWAFITRLVDRASLPEGQADHPAAPPVPAP